MKKAFLLLLVLCLILTGCGRKESLVPHRIEDLTIALPSGFMDLSDEAFAEELSFVFGLEPIAVNGLREEKASFEAFGLNLDLEAYGNFVILANNLSATLEQKDGIPTFSYESGGFTYLVTLWETDTAFWTVQAYCPAESYADAQEDMWEILNSITVS